MSEGAANALPVLEAQASALVRKLNGLREQRQGDFVFRVLSAEIDKAEAEMAALVEQLGAKLSRVNACITLTRALTGRSQAGNHANPHAHLNVLPDHMEAVQAERDLREILADKGIA